MHGCRHGNTRAVACRSTHTSALTVRGARNLGCLDFLLQRIHLALQQGGGTAGLVPPQCLVVGASLAHHFDVT